MLFRRTKGRLSCDGLRLSNCQLSNYSAFMTSANWDPFKVATTCCRALFRRFLLWASALVNQILGNAGERLSATKLSGPNKSHRGSNMIQENREDMRAKKACNYQKQACTHEWFIGSQLRVPTPLQSDPGSGTRFPKRHVHLQNRTLPDLQMAEKPPPAIFSPNTTPATSPAIATQCLRWVAGSLACAV